VRKIERKGSGEKIEETLFEKIDATNIPKRIDGRGSERRGRTRVGNLVVLHER